LSPAYLKFGMILWLNGLRGCVSFDMVRLYFAKDFPREDICTPGQDMKRDASNQAQLSDITEPIPSR
jgi:hypothetical protein